MTALREAAIAALEAMDHLHRTGDTQVFDMYGCEATEALRAALAEPVQEPVKQCMAHGECFGGECIYTSPPQRKPLSGIEVERLLEQVIGSLPVARRLIRAVEAAHGIKENT